MVKVEVHRCLFSRRRYLSNPNERMVGQPEIIQMAIERFKDEPFLENQI